MLTKSELQHLRSLQEKKYRAASGLYVVEGAKVIAELLKEGAQFEAIYATPTWERVGEVGAILREVTHAEMARISHYPTPANVLAVGRIRTGELSPGELNRGLTLMLDGVQDAGNVGTLLRIADWYAFDRVVCGLDCADLFSQKVINASMGSFIRVKTFSTALPEVLATVSVPVLGCDLEGREVYALEPLTDAIVVVGSEGRGLSAEVRKRVTQFVTIPRYGAAESLNAGVAAAIVCDNLRRIARR